MHQPKADVDRIYLSRKEGGRGGQVVRVFTRHSSRKRKWNMYYPLAHPRRFIPIKRSNPTGQTSLLKTKNWRNAYWLIWLYPLNETHLSKWLKSYQSVIEYKDLEIEIVRMTGLKTETVPSVIGALGLVKRGPTKILGKIPGKISIEELQKISLMGIAHILR